METPIFSSANGTLKIVLHTSTAVIINTINSCPTVGFIDKDKMNKNLSQSRKPS